jgi:uncharacterized membrane protein/predicted DsbA family dithiol-disulfide isomerase
MKATITALAAITTGLVASLALAHDYLFTPTMCATTGCDVVRQSAWSHPLGVPMPLVGIAFFVAMFVLLQLDAPRLRRAIAVIGALGAVTLVALQGLVIGAWCKLCLIVDTSSIVLAASVLAGAQLRRWRLPAAFGTAAIAGAAMLLLARAEPAPLPVPVVARAATVTIVEMVDFECPYCRAMNDRVEAAIARASGPVQVVRKMVPLSMHAHALPAALAWCCADAQGKGEAMAKALFTAEPATLTEEGCAKIAEQIGCDMARYRAHLPLAKDRVAADMREAKALGVRGLPTLFIGDQRVVGLTLSTDEIVDAIERARS